MTPKAKAGVYVTEKNVQIDRCACAWFITRYLDSKPTFKFIKQGEQPPAGISYDFFGADYFHNGPDCSYTNFVKIHVKKPDPALIGINAIVNDVFAWRNGPNSLSIEFKKYIDILAGQGLSDTEIYNNCLPIFDLLYLSNKGNTTGMSTEGKKATSQLTKKLFKDIYSSNANQYSDIQVIWNKQSIDLSKKQPDLKSLQKMLIEHPPVDKDKEPLYKLLISILKSKN